MRTPQRARHVIRFRLPDRSRVRALFAPPRQDVVPVGRIYSSVGLVAVQHIARLERERPDKLVALVTLLEADLEGDTQGGTR